MTGWHSDDLSLMIECCALLASSNSLANPVIYLLRDNRFQKVLKEIKVSAMRKRKNQVLPNIQRNDQTIQTRDNNNIKGEKEMHRTIVKLSK